MNFRSQFLILIGLLLLLIVGDIVYIALYNEINIPFEFSLLVATLMVIGALVYLVDKNAFGSLRTIREVSKIISEGSRSDMVVEAIPETEEIFRNLKDISLDLQEATKFIQNIGERKFDYRFGRLNTSEGLGKALVEMRVQLQEISKEEVSRNWTVTGIAKFSDLLRDNQHLDIEEIAYLFLKELILYIEANQGAVYILSRDEKTGEEMLHAVTSYAYARRKFLNKKFYKHEGLVGRCFLDEDLIYMDDIPANYIQVTSGLGESLPSIVVFAPIRVNEVTYGVIEIASFVGLEPYQRDFVKNISEDFASTVANAQINERTKELLGRSEAVERALVEKEELLRKAEQVVKQLEKRMEGKDSEIMSLKNALSAQ